MLLQGLPIPWARVLSLMKKQENLGGIGVCVSSSEGADRDMFHSLSEIKE